MHFGEANWSSKGLRIIQELNDNSPQLPISPELYRKNLIYGFNYLQEYEHEYIHHMLDGDLGVSNHWSGKWYLANKAASTLDEWQTEFRITSLSRDLKTSCSFNPF